jgi:hypothetical protein
MSVAFEALAEFTSRDAGLVAGLAEELPEHTLRDPLN